uniref:U7 snRNA-associated Sm-like protein LSm10 n=3 Tax=Sus scrofa TaxID=9823 RepID=A0A8D0YRG4_PIG
MLRQMVSIHTLRNTGWRGILLWPSRLRIQHCCCSILGRCCLMGLIPGPRTPREWQKETKKGREGRRETGWKVYIENLKEIQLRASSQWCGRMAVSHSVKERTISENSLIILLQGLQGQVTTVDLRDESVARGRIDNVDAFMNIRLAQVTYTDRWGHQVELDDLFVMGRNVRYVHIPDDVNITATIERQLQVIHRVRNFGGMGRREFPSKNSK